MERIRGSRLGEACIEVHELSHDYGSHKALAQLSLAISEGEIFVFLGPNGSGKSTLFRVLSTLFPPQSGDVFVNGLSAAREAASIRRILGVVFQSPSLDKKLTVRENLACQAALYGIRGSVFQSRSKYLLERFGLTGREKDYVETLSGGMRRRVELAKCLLHEPRVLVLDEPSTGLDPAARLDLWQMLEQLRKKDGVTVALTTHLLEEADKADRIAILDAGRLVALGAPSQLRSSVGGDTIVIESPAPAELATAIGERFGVAPALVEGAVRLEQPNGHQWISQLVDAFPERISSIRLGKPTLEDVFIAKTGRRLGS